MKRWTTQVLDIVGDATHETLLLNHQSVQGWELVAVVAFPNNRRAYFKRLATELPADADAVVGSTVNAYLSEFVERKEFLPGKTPE